MHIPLSLPSSQSQELSGFEVPTPEEQEARRQMAREIRYRRAHRTPYGRTRWQVMRMETSLSSLEKALQVYDPGLPPETKEVRDRLAQALGLQDIEWPTKRDQKSILDEKFDNALMKELCKLGYCYFTSYGHDGRNFLEIAPDEGKEPLALPKFLQIPYLVPVQGYTLRLRRENDQCKARTCEFPFAVSFAASGLAS